MAPEQVHARVSQPGSDASGTHANDDEIDQAIADAKDRADAVTADDATDWLETIDEALDEWAATSELAAQFVSAYIQKGGQ